MPSDSQYQAVPLADPSEDIAQRHTYDEHPLQCKNPAGPDLWERVKRSARAAFLIFTVTLTAFFLWGVFPSRLMTDDKSLARTLNATYEAFHDAQRGQHLFLGMPYALPPTGQLRFARPHHLNASWSGIRTAQNYSPHCIGYGDHQSEFNHSEDCLTINVVRPDTVDSSPLPVGVYIYGGGSHGGGSSDPRYNLSFIVAHAASNGMPFIGVSFNYRSSLWGFIGGRQATGSGNLNLGLRDQRLALHWIQENIPAFNGDPRKVTIWGGSSGADDVGLHLTAFGGRDDGLFRAAILQSGGPVTRLGLRQTSNQDVYDGLLSRVSCDSSEDTLECLRQVSFDELNMAFVDSEGGMSPSMIAMSLPAIDGDFVCGYGSLSLKSSNFVKVPILSGVVSDEGSSLIPSHISSWHDLAEYLIRDWKYPSPVMDRLFAFYPKSEYRSSQLEPPIKAIKDRGLYDRVKNLLGDLEIRAAQKLICQTYSQSLVPCYSFRFDAIATSNDDPRQGVTHGMEIAAVFQNSDGLGFSRNPFEGRGQGYYDMASAIGLRWASFITHLDPNFGLPRGDQFWPSYDLSRPRNLVFNETGPCWREPDGDRVEAIAFINEIQHGVLEK